MVNIKITKPNITEEERKKIDKEINEALDFIERSISNKKD